MGAAHEAVAILITKIISGGKLGPPGPGALKLPSVSSMELRQNTGMRILITHPCFPRTGQGGRFRAYFYLRDLRPSIT